jgi:mannitol/fructose-specific phosphotransferase system IIA component (Ntr-type)
MAARIERAPTSAGDRRLDGISMEGWMKLLDFVVQDAIVVDLNATGKEEAIREMVASLRDAGALAPGDFESVVRAILGREELGSTGIGQGVAVPHTRHPTLSRLIGAVALSRDGVDFAALDSEPVDIFFLLVSPQNQPGDHLRALENISRHLKDERFVKFLRQARTRESVIEILEESDQQSA